ncbi:hypothetical protein MKW94_016664 [Papaver nudicaule]|uniref:Uncharacterized protein n=1 Tax=Papaver nudicaule TaxID=74823 RepID=A0AA41VXJ1_PAPNU|nr:hypothetical protein [Papaver nudicaule]
MGTAVQCKSYSPVFHPMRDLNEDANSGNWPVYYDDNKMLKNEQYYNCFVARSEMNGYSDYDREVLKQTILEHDNVFRKQVYELHRLYKTQRDLMNELRRKESQKYSRPTEVSQSSSPFSSHTPSEDVKTWQIPSFPLVNPNCNKPCISGADSMQSPSTFVKESSVPVTPNAVQNGSIYKEGESLKSKSKQVARKMFDLQLPADEYVDSDGEQNGEEKGFQSSSMAAYPSKLYCGVVSGLGTKLSLGGGVNLDCQKDASHVSNRLGLADLNQPLQVEETIPPSPVEFFRTAVSFPGGNQGQGQPTKSNYPGFPREFSLAAQSSGSHQNDVRLENEGEREQLYNLEAGQSRESLDSFRLQKLPAQSSSPKVDLTRTHEYPTFSVSDTLKRQPWREKAVCGFEIPESSQSHSKYLRSALESRVPTSYPCVSQSENMTEFSSVSSWMKPTNNFHEKSTEVRALPCLNSSSPFESSSVQNPVVVGNGWNFNNNPRPNSSCGTESSSKNGFYHGSQSEYTASKVPFHSTRFDFLNGNIISNSALEQYENHSPTKIFRGLECVDVKSARGVNLNLAVPNGYQDEAFRRRDIVIIDGEGKNGDRPMGLPWRGAKVACENGSTMDRAAGQQDLVIIDGEGKNEDRPLGLPWLRANLTREDRPATVDRVIRQRPVIINVEAKNEDQPLGLPWLRGKLVCDNGPTVGKGYTNKTGLSSSHQVNVKVAEACNVSASSLFQNFNSSSSTSGSWSVRAGDGQDTRKILGVPIFDKSHSSKCQNILASPAKCQFPSRVEETQKSGKVIFNIDLSEEPPKAESSSGLSLSHNLKGLDVNSSGYRNDFNLNLSLDEEENSAIQYIPKPMVKVAVEIDLEAAAVPEPLEESPLDGDCSLNQLETNVQSSATKDPQIELERFASEAIVLISSSTKFSDNSAVKSSEESLKHSLNWFADVVSSMAGLEIETKDREESSCESDYFESMTLKLTETKLEELPCQIWVPENQKEEETVNCAMPTRRRRGQSRRGRQKKDFQRDILPGLVSLSRHEVTEDLQTFGGLMRATGHSWQSSLTRRNAARNGWARGRKRTHGPAAPPPPTVICSPPKEQPNNVDVTERSLKGWGKTTRRPRRQRAAGTPVSLTYQA